MAMVLLSTMTSAPPLTQPRPERRLEQVERLLRSLHACGFCRRPGTVASSTSSRLLTLCAAPPRTLCKNTALPPAGVVLQIKYQSSIWADPYWEVHFICLPFLGRSLRSTKGECEQGRVHGLCVMTAKVISAFGDQLSLSLSEEGFPFYSNLGLIELAF